jgi:hypothetical protein
MKKIIFYLFTCAFLFGSCSDYLNKYPLDSPSDQTFLSTETEMDMALAGCYTPIWLDLEGMSFFLAFEEAADMGYERNTSGLQQIGQGSADAKNDMARNYWTAFYKGIARCNYLLQNMPRGEANVPAASYTRIQAEARFLRALYYSYLIELYGDVPLTRAPLTLAESQISRTPKSEIVDFILSELTGAAADLSPTNNPISGRPSRGAALAIKARVALYNERWQDAISAASEVMAMEDSQYILEDDYAKLFRYDGQTSKEIIFSIQYLKGQKVHPIYRLFGTRNAGGHTNKKPAYQLQDAYECVDGLAIDKSPLYNPAKPYENRDPRLGYTLAVPGSEFLGFQFETHGDSVKCWNYLTNARVDNQDVLNAYATFTGICWRKYANVEDRTGINDCDNNTILIRYAEVLLTYAEAKIKAGQIDASVLEAINKVRRRPSVDMPPITTTNPTELFHAVARERKYELSGEGHRLFDIRRWRIAEEVMNHTLLGRMKRSYPDRPPRIDEWATAHYEGTGIPISEPGGNTDFAMRVVDIRKFDANKDYLWPIPYIERQTNPNMTQNPNWE